MIQNTVQTLIDEVKELSGLTNASTGKIIRALNRGADRISVIKQLKASKTNPDSSNHTDLSSTSVTTSALTLSLSGGTLDEGEALTFRHIDLVTGDTFKRLIPIDSRDADYEYLQNQTGEPTHIDIEGNILRPLPKPDGSYTYRLSYGRVHPRFSEDNLTQATGLLPVEEEFVIMYAVDRLMIGSNDPSRVGVRNEISSLTTEIEKMTALRDQTASKRITPRITNAFRSNQF